MRSVSETLAGRVALLELTPLLCSELAGTARAADRWFWGGFPPIHGLRDSLARSEWFDAYVSTFLERDLPALGIGLPARRLRALWTMLTHVHGNLLNVCDLARSLAVSSHTIAGDLDVLEGAFMIRRLPPYYANVQKRLTKSAKLYVRDTGLVHFLAGLRRPPGVGDVAQARRVVRRSGDRRARGARRASAGSSRVVLLADTGRRRG